MQASLSHLPEDLLAHVLRFATGAARRDANPPAPVPLSDWRYASVSHTFRRAFLKNLTSLALTTPAAKRLAALDWQPLTACTSLRYLVVGPESGLTDRHVIRLFHVLNACGIRLRQADITVDRSLTQASVLCFASLFGSSVTHLDVRVPWIRRVRRRRYEVLHLQPNGPYLPQLAPVHHDDPAVPPAPVFIPFPPVQPAPHLPNAPVPVINIFDGVQLHNHAADFDDMANMIGGPPAHPPPPADDLELAAVMEDVHEQLQHLQHLPQLVHQNALHPPAQHHQENPDPLVDHALQPWDLPAEDADLPNPNNPQVLLADGLPNPPPHGDAPPQMPPFVPQIPHTSSIHTSLSNDVFATVVSRLTGLQELVIDRARHITNTGILALANCTRLETLVLYGNHSINDVAMNTILARMDRLKVLRLRDMVLIGDGTVKAVCTGGAKTILQFLELTRVGRVTDPAVKRLVNSCENLRTVHIFDCPHISCEAASHLSCSRRITDVLFKPQSRFPLMNRTSVHLSCASSTLRSLQLVGCKNLSLDGIVALGNLPGLRRLHLNGLGHISQDIMRALGVFPRLDDLALHGAMHLTDLGVKVLIGQRGHRFLHLSLLDSTRNLTDEALDCIMTWCLSLRTLEVHGVFKAGAADRLHEVIPNASVTVVSSTDGRKCIQGTGGVWDPIHTEV